MNLGAQLHHAVPLWALAFIGTTSLIACGLIGCMVWTACHWPKPGDRPRPPTDPDDDAMPSYRQIWEQLPPHIQASFHPEWPWLAPPALTQREPGKELADEIRNLETGDPEFLGI